MDDTGPTPAIDDTREQLLAAAHRQFAARGFHGASISLIAGELELTKQALLYHFHRKEDLYREVLHRIAQRMFVTLRTNVAPFAPAAQRFEDAVMGVYAAMVDNPLDAKVLMHELLEHQRRDAPEDDWFFKAWIDKHVALLVEARGDHDRPNAEAVAQVYMLASAICYYAASGPVLVRFYGEGEFAAIEDAYERELRALVRRMIAGG